jgi:hypothetical protein
MNNEEREKHRLEFRETFAKTGHETLKALLIVSGGAAVTYLTFLSAIFGKEGRFETFGAEAVTVLVLAMQYYILSVASALLSYVFTWFSHGFLYFNLKLACQVTMAIYVIFGFLCLGLFVFGSLEAISAFKLAAKHISS